jgi:8-oxo-dGTP pyrophosphatase MutT (NUDIX family)
MGSAAVPRKSATLVVVRQAEGGLELLLLQRADKGDQNSGAWVFPGGLVEAADRDCHPQCAGLDDTAASARLGPPQGGLDFYVAAIRECFEEAGLLFAVDKRDELVDLRGETGARLAALRRPLHAGECGFGVLCRDNGLRLAADRLFYIGHWVTPLGLPKRFDTRFFLAVLPAGQASLHDSVETLDQVWIRPEAALAPEHSRRLLKVTRHVIELVGRFPDLDSLLAWARAPREVVMVMQRRGMGAAGLRSLMPHEPGFDEIGKLDPEGEGTAWCELRPGVPVQLSPHVQRVTSPGGHNSYRVGDEESGWTEIDSGRPCLLVDDRMLFSATMDAAQALQLFPPGAVEWIAPAQGFLVAASTNQRSP